MGMLSAMDESERNRLLKQQKAVLLAASDMEEAAAAARALVGIEDGPLAHALETAIIVCYARPFTTGDRRVPRGFDELDSESDASLHAELKKLRDEAYAHTDEGSGREIARYAITERGDGTAEISYWEARLPIERESLPLVISLCERQAERMKSAAIRLQLMLTGEKPVEYW